jgi:hypothetical protein
MTDRELLELAAKAAGVEIDWQTWVTDPKAVMGCCFALAGTHTYWNPLTDDGDALRLFCALPWLCIETSDVGVTVRERGNPDEPTRVYLMWTEWLDKHNGDVVAATRRAIVRAAAAEIGRLK